MQVGSRVKIKRNDTRRETYYVVDVIDIDSDGIKGTYLCHRPDGRIWDSKNMTMSDGMGFFSFKTTNSIVVIDD